jgi:dipeptidyl aminopeptidase/acylaminoacyl peptidase
VVSSLGGGSKRIADGGEIARWRPDGQRVGYMKGPGPQARSKSNKFEFWSVGADGADNRLEFTDTIGVTANSRYSWCWSPDGNSIGWLRTNDRFFQSIVVHELATGAERVLVGGEERMDDISWTASDEVIYSSNRAGNTNLWTVPGGGGTPAQITKGSGPDIGIKVSADGRSLVYLQQLRIGNIWLGSFEDGAARQLTFDEREIGSPVFSPDAQKIAFQMTDPDPLKLGSGIYVMEKGGGERRRITPEREFAQNPKWSPDGKWIAYQAVNRSDSGQAVEVRVIDATNPGTPKTLGKGNLWGWLNERIVLIQDNAPLPRLFLAAANDTLRKQCFIDSTIGIPLLGGKYFAYVDFRDSTVKTFQVRKSSGPSLEELLKGPGKTILPAFTGKPDLVSFSAAPWQGWDFADQNADYFGYWKNGTEVWKYRFLTGKDERVNVRFPGFIAGVRAALSAKGTEIVYADQRLSSKLVMIENLFK